MAQEDDWPSPALDLTKASSARVYDYLLGGKDHFAIDRETGDRIRERMPGVQIGVRAQRAALGRGVRYLVGEIGLRQLVDVGTGLPTADNVHQVARSVAPGVRVAYIDNDPVVLVHARALLATDADTVVIEGDLRHPDKLLADPRLTGHIDLQQPVGLILCGILHNVMDEDDPWDKAEAMISALPSGSYVFIHHLLNRGDDTSQALQSLGRSRYRERHDIERFFAGLEIVEPGLVTPTRWRPDEFEVVVDDDPALQMALMGVGRKP